MQLSGRPLLGTALDASLFVGRETELARLERAVRLGFNALVLGARGSGTTSLLHELARRLRLAGRPEAMVDARGADDAAGLLTLVRGRLPFVDGLSDAPAPPPARALDLLDHLASVLRGEDRIVVLVDQPSPAVAHALFGRLRDEVWRLPLRWVVCGLDADRAAYLTPPADAFFEIVVTLGGLDLDDSVELLRRRVEAEEADLSLLAETAEAGGGNPRVLIAAARERLVDGRSAASLRADAERWDEALASLRPPSRRLVEELRSRGAASASDEGLLRRLGWSRSRAAQVFGDLERRGLVRAGRDGRGTRPRKVYAPVEADRLPAVGPGDRVRHARAGDGRVESIHQDQEGGPVAEVAFEDGAIRRLPLAALGPVGPDAVEARG